MNLSLDRMILFVRDVPALTDFYRDILGLAVVETIEDEWAVLQAGPCELALHQVGAPYRRSGARSRGPNSNAKPVFVVQGDFVALRDRLIADGVPMGDIRPNGSRGPFCDGVDPEGNVFQIAANTLGVAAV